MQTRTSILISVLVSISCGAHSQNVGINTNNPVRTLEINGVTSQFARVHSTSFFGNEAGLELIRGDNNSNARDWKITNDSGIFKISSSTNNFNSTDINPVTILNNGYVGIGTSNPVSRLHVDGQPVAPDGIMLLGQKSSANLVVDEDGILARNNDSPASMYIQASGGNTSISNVGAGNVYLGLDGGTVGIGTTFALGKLNVNAANFQMYIRNQNTTVNDWYIGTSDDSWLVGDDQLVFSPTTSSADAPLRLMDVDENDGNTAPVIITSGTQELLLDGNEIETKSGGLYINHNSDQNTYINPSGGDVGIGTTSPISRLHIKTTSFALGLQQDADLWRITPLTDGNLAFAKDGLFVSLVAPWTGVWTALSDQRLKEDIQPVQPVMNRIMSLPVYTYGYVHDETAAHDIGVVAQDLEPLFPEVVSKNEDQYAVAYDLLAVLAIKGIQEQQAQLEKINSQLGELLQQ